MVSEISTGSADCDPHIVLKFHNVTDADDTANQEEATEPSPQADVRLNSISIIVLL